MKCIDRKYYDHSDPNFWMLYSNYEEFEHIPTKTEYPFIYSNAFMTVYDDFENIVYNWYEEPNCLVANGIHETVLNNDKKIYKLLNPCKYSVECYNKMYSTDKWQLVFFPFNPAYTPKHEKKIYDVYYTGNFYCAITPAFPIIEKYNPCFVCHNYGNHSGVSYLQKLDLNAKSKISITHGLLQWPIQYRNIVDQYPDHKGFNLMKSHGIVPQFKTRNLEAIASKSLVLCLYDPWNEIEDYFTPNEDFIYWYNLNDLEEKIKYILNNYDEFIPLIENAYTKLMNNFTTTHYFNKFLKYL